MSRRRLAETLFAAIDVEEALHRSAPNTAVSAGASLAKRLNSASSSTAPSAESRHWGRRGGDPRVPSPLFLGEIYACAIRCTVPVATPIRTEKSKATPDLHSFVSISRFVSRKCAVGTLAGLSPLVEIGRGLASERRRVFA